MEKSPEVPRGFRKHPEAPGNPKKAPNPKPTTPNSKQTKLTGVLSFLFSNNVCIMLLFIGLILTSVIEPSVAEEGDDGEDWIESVGMAGFFCVWASLLIPVINYIRYFIFKRKIQQSAYVPISTRPIQRTCAPCNSV